MNESTPVRADSMDHIAFACPFCEKAADVISVTTRNVSLDAKNTDKCTWIRLSCETHGEIRQRKFYWTGDDGMLGMVQTHSHKADPDVHKYGDGQ